MAPMKLWPQNYNYSEGERRRGERNPNRETALANGYQPEVNSHTENVGKEEQVEYNSAKVLTSHTIHGKHIDKVIKVFKKLDVNVGISNNAAIWRGVAMIKQRKGGTKAGSIRSPVNNARASMLGKLEGSSAPK